MCLSFISIINFDRIFKMKIVITPKGWLSGIKMSQFTYITVPYELNICELEGLKAENAQASYFTDRYPVLRTIS